MLLIYKCKRGNPLCSHSSLKSVCNTLEGSRNALGGKHSALLRNCFIVCDSPGGQSTQVHGCILARGGPSKYCGPKIREYIYVGGETSKGSSAPVGGGTSRDSKSQLGSCIFLGANTS